MSTIGTLSDFGTVGQQYGRLLLARMFRKSKFLRWFDQQSGWELGATKYWWDVVPPAEASMKTRALNSNFTSPTTFNPPDPLASSLAIHGGFFNVDISIMADVRNGLENRDRWHDRKLQQEFDNWVKAYEALLFNGTGASSEIKGLKTILDGTDLDGYAGITRVQNMADYDPSLGDSFDLSVAANYPAFIEAFINIIEKVPDATGIVCNRQFKARMTSIARGAFRTGQVNASLQNNAVEALENIPLIPVLDGTIGNAEPDDAGTPVNETTSFYIMRPGEDALSLVSNSGIYFRHYDDTDNDEKSQTKWEIRADWKIREYENILRVRNIKL